MNKSKNLIYFLTVTVILFMTTACGLANTDENGKNGDAYGNGTGVYSIVDSDENNAHGEQDDGLFSFTSAIVFEETGQAVRARGYNYFAFVNNREYFFTDSAEERNLAFVAINERLISEISRFADLGAPPFRFLLANSAEDYSTGSSEIAFNHDNNDTVGWLVHVWSGGRIPMWLSAGIEAVALSNMGEFEATDSLSLYIPELFGDLLLSPGNWGTQDQLLTIHAAYHFVRYLIDTGVFEDAISLFRSRDETVNELIRTYFYEFSGGKQISDIQYTILAGGAGIAYRILIPSDWVLTQYFSFNCFSQHYDNRTISLFVDYFESGYEFVYNWFAQHYDFELNPSFASTIFGYRGNPLPPQIGLSLPIKIEEHITEGGASFLPFSWGLAGVLVRMFHIADRDSFGVFYTFWNENVMDSDSITNEILPLYTMILESQATAEYFIDRNVAEFDLFSITHFEVYAILYHPEFFDNLPENILNPEISIYISTRGTAASFVAYLIETYGSEKYAQVHFDLDNFENVYGVTLHEMVDRWRGFLRAFADDIRTGRW